MILILGIAHSHTSAIAKFLYDNGGNFLDIVHNWHNDLPYDKYEDADVLQWVKDKKKLHNPPFPVKDGICKAPDATFFIHDIPKEVKIIYCLRSTRDLMLSRNDKCGTGFMEEFNRVTHVYEKALYDEHDIYFVPTERILNGMVGEATRLLDFCGIKTDNIIFNLQPIKARTKHYIPYRIENLFWKMFRWKK